MTPREWLENREDAELLLVIEAAEKEWEKKGGRPWAEAEREMEEAIIRREKGQKKGKRT